MGTAVIVHVEKRLIAIDVNFTAPIVADHAGVLPFLHHKNAPVI